MKKIYKGLGILILLPVTLLLLAGILLYIPFVQQKAVTLLTDYVTTATGMKLSVEQVRLAFPIKITASNASLIDPAAQPGDTIAAFDKFAANVELFPLFRGKIKVGIISLQRTRVHTGSLIGGVTVNGEMDLLELSIEDADLKNQIVTLDNVRLNNSDLSVLVQQDTIQKKDTIQKTDTTQVRWKVNLRNLKLKDVALTMAMPDDSMHLQLHSGDFELKNGFADLFAKRYQVESMNAKGLAFSYDQDSVPQITEGMDVSHLRLTDIQIEVDSIFYSADKTRAKVASFSFKEKSGFELSSMEARFMLTKELLQIEGMSFHTPFSSLALDGSIPLGMFTRNLKDSVTLNLEATLRKEDFFYFIGRHDSTLSQSFPKDPCDIRFLLTGTGEKIKLEEMTVSLPGALNIVASGTLFDPSDSLLRRANLNWNVKSGDLSFVKVLLDNGKKSRYRLPVDMRFDGTASVKGTTFDTDLRFSEGKGDVLLTAAGNLSEKRGHAKLTMNKFRLQDFFPNDSVGRVTATVNMEMLGLDPYNRKTTWVLDAVLDAFRFGGKDYSGMTAKGNYKANKGKLLVESSLKPLDLTAQLDGTLTRKKVTAQLALQVRNLDLHYFQWVTPQATTSFNLKVNGATDMKKTHQVGLELSKGRFVTDGKKDTLKTIRLNATTNDLLTDVTLEAGDLNLKTSANDDPEALMLLFDKLSKEVNRQVKERSFHLEALKETLPALHLVLKAGSDNPLTNYLKRNRLCFSSLEANLTVSPEKGFSGSGTVLGLQIDTISVDSVSLSLNQDSLLYFSLGATKKYGDPRFRFSGNVNAALGDRSLDLGLLYKNGEGKKGMQWQLHATRLDSLLDIRMADNPIIAFTQYTLNKDQQMRVNLLDKKIVANITMTGDNGSELSFRTLNDTLRHNKLQLYVHSLPLSPITGLSPFLPSMAGLVDADVFYAISDSSFSLDAEAGVRSFVYQKHAVGNIKCTLSYLPGADQSHRLTAALNFDTIQVLQANAMYKKQGKSDSINGTLTIHKCPLWPANLFIPDRAVLLSGAFNGQFTVQGTVAKPLIEGSMKLDTAKVFIPSADSRFTFENKEIFIKGNKLVFDKYNIFASGKNPLVVDGVVDLNKRSASIDLKATNYQLMNSRQRKESLIYGKAFINLDAKISGSLQALKMRGNVRLLGTSDVTYLMKDSRLTAKDRLEGLVTFVSFADTTRKMEAPKMVTIGGMDMLINVRLDPAVRVNVDMSDKNESYIELIGGGNLTYQHTPTGDMYLNGRYTLTGGSVKYAYSVIPSKVFAIQEGSYMEWNGAVEDPTINLKAINKVNTSVIPEGQASRMVHFDVIIGIQNRLNNLRLTFDLSAPEDMTIQNELTSMTAEERSLQALNVLVSNSYRSASSSSSGNVNMTSALSNFLQNEIAGLVGDGLKNTEFNIGVENYQSEGAQTRTDYSFSFAQKFYNNRIRFVIGGKVTTGQNTQTTQNEESFIDNISVEYRLDISGTRFVRLFYDRTYESLLEGEVIQMGTGLVLQRRMSNLLELFKFKK